MFPIFKNKLCDVINQGMSRDTFGQESQAVYGMNFLYKVNSFLDRE